MGSRSDFSNEEWAVVVGAPLKAAMLVIASERGGGLRETVAVARAYDAAKKAATGALLTAVLETPPAAAARPARGASLREDALAALVAAIDILGRRVDPQEAADYRRFVLSLGEAAARAHAGRQRAPTAEQELQALKEIEEAMTGGTRGSP